MMRSRLIVDGGLHSTAEGFDCIIRLPWYRTLPLSVIDMPVVKLDGVVVPDGAVRLEVNGQVFDAAGLRHATQVWWYVLDRGVLHVASPYPSGVHDLTVEVHFCPPYIPELTLLCAATRPLAAA